MHILRSQLQPDRHYIGTTGDLEDRLARHNSGDVSHTAKFAPWQVKIYLAFEDKAQAFAFEKYLKTASGRAFAKKRL